EPGRTNHQRRHGHGDGAGEISGVLRHAEGTGRAGARSTDQDRRRGKANPARKGRARTFGERSISACRPFASEEFRVARTPKSRATVRSRIAGAVEERAQSASDIQDGGSNTCRWKR